MIIDLEAFKAQYCDLIIKQYHDNPKAKAEIELYAEQTHKIANFLCRFDDEFDVDQATGDRLDIIGRIVGINRTTPEVLPRLLFGFDDDPSANGFGDEFESAFLGAPFADKFESQLTSQTLDDNDYRFFIKAKIAKNNSHNIMVSDEVTSILDVVEQLFNGEAYVVNTDQMRLALYITPSFDLDRLRLILKLDLLPRPQGVTYDYIVQADIQNTFGFLDDPDAEGFADKFDTQTNAGSFASKIAI